LFDSLSAITMRYVSPVPTKKAEGLNRRVYDMVTDDFFINGTITSHSKVPALMAGMWTGGREVMLISDRLHHTIKEAMSGTLSMVNQCPYCADMLIGLVNGGGEHEIASRILTGGEANVSDARMREILGWAKAAAAAGPEGTPEPPFAPEEMPEAVGCLFIFSYINRWSHVVMDGSPMIAPLGLTKIKEFGLRLFGWQLSYTTEQDHLPGRALALLPAAPLPDDLWWSKSNPRIAGALARWTAVIEQETPKAVPSNVRRLVEGSLRRWNGEPMPISRSWVDAEVEELTGEDRAIAKLALVVGKASWQFDDSLALAVLLDDADEARFIRILAWASFAAARRVADRIAWGTNRHTTSTDRAA
jgi:hypothetical protein